MLVVVENRNFHPFAQLAFDDEALRRLDVFQIDAAEGGLQRADDVHQLVRILLCDFDVIASHAAATPGEYASDNSRAFNKDLVGVTRIFPAGAWR